MSHLELGVAKKSVLEAMVGSRSHKDLRITMRACLTIALVLSGLVWQLQAAHAQDIPPGSYQDSCRNITYDGKNLSAECASASGEWGWTGIDMSLCATDPSNNNGALDCAMRTDGPPPAGSYTMSCYQIRMVKQQLVATCKMNTEGWSGASLDTDKCRPDSDIANIYGNLTCSGGDAPAPAGSYQMSCFGVNMKNGTLKAICQRRDQSWTLNGTSLSNVSSCSGDIWNDDGNLGCSKRLVPPPPGQSRPMISFDIARRHLTGNGFVPNAKVFIRIVVPGAPGYGTYDFTFANSSGNIDYTVVYFACPNRHSGSITANDDRWDSSRSDFLWSNVYPFNCQ